MTIDDKFRGEKLKLDITGEKILVLSSAKIDKYECLTGEEILPSDQRQIIEQAKFSYSPLRKTFEKKTKMIEDEAIKKSNL